MSTPTILVVDDQPSMRRLITRLLKRNGLHTIEAGSGAQALTLFDEAAELIEMAIIDMALPQMSGLDVAAALGRRQSRLKFLYLSAYSRSIAIDSIRHRSPELLLMKPFTDQSLIDRVFGLLGITTPSVPPPTQSDIQCDWRPIPD